MTDFVGMQLGNYRVIRLLGQGGFADVYLGEHIYLKTQAAIKVLQTRLSNEDMETFLKEAQMISSLVHPNIVRVLEFGIEAATPYLVMDYAPNGTLRQRHPRGSRLPPGVIVPYVKQVATALQYAHDKKLIHRDVKPENMLVGPNNEILLSDFGIALIAQSSRYQSTQDVVGTLAYMAPEQFQGRPVAASDQYALGIVVYEWLVGERPFHGSFGEIASQHMMALPSLCGKTQDISLAIEEVVRTALAKEPQQRFLRVQAFANAFEQATQAFQAHQAQPAQPAWSTPMPAPPPSAGRLPPLQSAASGSVTPPQPQRWQPTPQNPDMNPSKKTPSVWPSSPVYGTSQQAQFNQSGSLVSPVPPVPPASSGSGSNMSRQAPPFGASQGQPSSPGYGQMSTQPPGQSGTPYPYPAPSSPLVVPPPQQTLPPHVAASYSDQSGTTYPMHRQGQQGQGQGAALPPQPQSLQSGQQSQPKKGAFRAARSWLGE